jgi:hypothetical protein
MALSACLYGFKPGEASTGQTEMLMPIEGKKRKRATKKTSKSQRRSA